MTKPGLELRFSATADLYFLLRELAALPDGSTAGAWVDAVEPARAVFGVVAALPSHAIDPHIAGWPGTDAELAASAAGLPEEIGPIPARRFVSEVARLLATYRDRYEATSMASREAAASETIKEIRELLPDTTEDACLSFICDSFSLERPATPVRVVVVAGGVPLGGVTGWDHNHDPVCAIARNGLSGSLLAEAVLHEAVHALGMMASNSAATPIARLQEQTAARGLGRRGPYGQLWHVPYFVTAAETVRRFVDDDHTPYGVARGYYDRAGEAATIAVPLWSDVLQGHLTADDAVDRMIEALPGADSAS